MGRVAEGEREHHLKMAQVHVYKAETDLIPSEPISASRTAIVTAGVELKWAAVPVILVGDVGAGESR